MQVQNKQIIRKLVFRSMKAARLRNGVAVAAIVLTSILFTAFFSIGANMLKSFEEATMRQVGTSAHGGLKYLTQLQYDAFQASPLIEDISYTVIIGIAENEALSKKQTEIRYGEDEAAQWMFSYPTQGHMPEEIHEVAVSTITLDMLGLPYELGVEIPLEYTLYGEPYSEVFTLCGYWAGDDVMQATQVWVSSEYMESVVTIPEVFSGMESMDDIAGTINADVWFSNSVNLEEKLDALVAACGFDAQEILYGVNWAYVGSDLDLMTVLVGAVVVLLILFSGYLIIYSVFMISVGGDIRFYGLLKTIGTTGRQLRRIVYGQAFLLCLIGIPLGLLLGYLLGYQLTPSLMAMTSFRSITAYSMSPWIFLFSALFSLLTVFISCLRPGRVAARISPVEAVSYTEGKSLRKRKKRTKRVTPYSMALSNVGRSKGRLVMIVISLSLSIILLNSVYSMVRGFDINTYLQHSILSDFSVAHHSVYVASVQGDDYEGVGEAFQDALAQSEHIERMDHIYFTDEYFHKLSAQGLFNVREIYEQSDAVKYENSYVGSGLANTLETGEYPLHIYGLGEMGFSLVTEQSGAISFETLAGGNYVLVTGAQGGNAGTLDPVYRIGDRIPLENKAGEVREFEVLGYMEYPYPLSCRHGHMIDQTVVMATEQYLEFYGEKNPMMSIFDVKDGAVEEMELWLEGYCSFDDISLDYRSRGFYQGEFEGMQSTFLLLGGTLSFVLALIGILNFLNTMVTSIFSRRRELAMLQSVGMTGRQMKAMLYSEGAVYALLTLLFSLTVGSLIAYGVIQGVAGAMWFFRFYFSVLPLILAIIPLLALCMFIPMVCCRRLQQQTVVDRLRTE